MAPNTPRGFRRKSMHFVRSQAEWECFRKNEQVYMLFLSLQTRFLLKMAGISTCVLIIHVVGKQPCHKQAIYQQKREAALIPIKRFTAKGMYTIHTTRNSCQKSLKSCRKWHNHRKPCRGGQQPSCRPPPVTPDTRRHVSYLLL